MLNSTLTKENNGVLAKKITIDTTFALNIVNMQLQSPKKILMKKYT